MRSSEPRMLILSPESAQMVKDIRSSKLLQRNKLFTEGVVILAESSSRVTKALADANDMLKELELEDKKDETIH